jgi:flagellar protein FliJ
MTRTGRMAPVQQVMDDSERKHAQQLADAQRRLAESEQKLAELQRYHQEYAQAFGRQAAAGATGLMLRDYQVFLGRLADAVRQQSQFVARAREAVAVQTHHWQGAAQRAKALGTVVQRWRGEERREVERRDQQETDERAQQLLRQALRSRN